MTHSHSSLSLFRQCPHRYHQVRVLKLYPFIRTPENEFGDRVHKALEMAVGHGVPLPSEMAVYQWVVDMVLSLPGAKHVEVDVSVSSSGDRVDKWDWKNKYFNAKSDVLVIDGAVATVIDYKTGKVKEANDQLDINAMLVFMCYPQVTEVRAAALFVQTGDVVPSKLRIIGRDQLGQLQTRFGMLASDVALAATSGRWPKKQSGLCAGYCEVSTCENYKEKRK